MSEVEILRLELEQVKKERDAFQLKYLLQGNKRLNEIITSQNKRQFIQPEREKDNPIKIKDRLIQLKYLTQAQLDTILGFKLVDGKKVFHADKMKFVSAVGHISQCINREKNKIDDDGTGVEPKGRKNTYYENEYVRFGDNIIHQYLKKFPFDKSIDFENWKGIERDVSR